MKHVSAGLTGTPDRLFSSRDLVRLIFPLVVEQFLAVAVGIADTMMVASVGESAVSAVSLVDSINILLINIFAALATGGAVVAGQYLGQKRPAEASRAGEQLLVFTGLIALGIMALLYALRYWVLHTVFGQITPEVMGYANTYYLIVSASIPFIALYNSGAALFRVMGNSAISMRTSLLMNGINIAGNALLIFVFHLGVEGVAIPTLVSRAVAAVVVVALLRNQSLSLHIRRPFRYRPDSGMIRRILQIGVPNSLENSMFQLGKILLMSLVSTFGTVSIAANAVSNTIASFQVLPGMAIGLALVTVVSRCVGAGDYPQARYYTRKLMGITFLSMWAVNGLILLCLPWILKLYQLSPETTGMASQILWFHGSVAMFVWPWGFTLPNTLRSANDVKYTMVVSVVSMWACRIVLGYVFGRHLGMGVFGVWVAMILDWVIRAILFIVRYCSTAWQRKKLLT